MDAGNIFQENVDEHIQVIQLACEQHANTITDVTKLFATCLNEAGTIFWCGNGGSASDSQHLAAELVGRFKKNRRPLRSLALTTDTSVLTCIANDFSYADIFSRQVEALARPKDILVVISTSGQSENILQALVMAKKMDVITVALLGKSGGVASELADYSIVVDSDTTARIQETHIFMGHLLCELIEKEMGFA
jgi:D-sedoheptulose 7-phosphate isomerase